MKLFKKKINFLIFRPLSYKISKFLTLSLLLFIFACSDKSCIEANDFGEYETDYLSVNPGIDTSCKFTLQEPHNASGGESNDFYYTPTPSFELMQDSEDFNKFIEIISHEYQSFINQEIKTDGQYHSFFTIFDGELGGYINGNEGNDSDDGDDSYRNYLSILINQQNRILFNRNSNAVEIFDPSLSDEDMVKFLYGVEDEDIAEQCEGSDKYCPFIDSIIDRYKWYPKDRSNVDPQSSHLGCVMEQRELDDSVRTGASTNNVLTITYPPLNIFLQCINKAINKCEADKISQKLQDYSILSSNDRISRSFPPAKTDAYDPDINDSLIITPQSNIYIRSVGEISLGSNLLYPDMFVDPLLPNNGSALLLQSNNNLDPDFSNWRDFSNPAMNLSIKSDWQIANDIYHTAIPNNNNNLKSSYNALSRLVMYIDDYNVNPAPSIDFAIYSINTGSNDNNFNYNDDSIIGQNINSDNIEYYIKDSYEGDAILVNFNIVLHNTLFSLSGISNQHDAASLIDQGALNLFINSQRICDANVSEGCLDISTNDNKEIENVILNKGGVFKIQFSNTDNFDISQFNLIDSKDNINNIFQFSKTNNNVYFSDIVEYSGLYSTEAGCSDEFKVINNTDLYTDIRDRDFSVNINNTIYLRKGQKTYFEDADENLVNCSLTLQHRRPAFLCKKRAIPVFYVKNVLCTFDNKAFCVTANNSCLSGEGSCDIKTSYGAISSPSDTEEAVGNLINNCKSVITYDEENELELHSCTSFINNQCKMTYPDIINNNELVNDPNFSNCIEKCTNCIEDSFSYINLPDGSYGLEDIDICYDLENYIGKTSDITNDTIIEGDATTIEQQIEQQISPGYASPEELADPEYEPRAVSTYKGARELSFNGIYGNFVQNGEFLLNNNQSDNSKYSGLVNLSKVGKIKFLVVNNNNLDLDNSDYSSNYDNNFIDDIVRGDGNGYLVEFGSVDNIYRNGHMMESYLCYSGSGISPSCSTLERSQLIADSVNNSTLVGIAGYQYNVNEIEYQNICKSAVNADTGEKTNFGYYFNKFGQLEEMNKEDSNHCPNLEIIPNNKGQVRRYYSNDQNQINDSKDFQLYFSIIDDQENNCLMYKDDVNSSSDCDNNLHYDHPITTGKEKCNGIKMDNPYYIGEDTECMDGYLIENPHYNLSASGDIKDYCKYNCKEQHDTPGINQNECYNNIILNDINISEDSRYLCSDNCDAPTSKANMATDEEDFCQDTDISKCNDRKYYCANKLFDNYGSYEVEVKVKDSSKFHSIIYNMLSPITDFIYGSAEICIEGKELFTQEGEYIGLCKEIEHGKSSINSHIFGNNINFRDSRKKEYVILNNNNTALIQKYQQPLGKYACKNNRGQAVDDKSQCDGNNFANIINDSNIINVASIDIREGNIYEYGERILHPEYGYVFRKDSMAKTVYVNIINNDIYKILFKTLMVLALMFYGGSYLMGMSEFSRAEIMTRVIKIGFLMLLLSPSGWFWFQNIFVSFFEKGADYLSILMISSFESDEVVNNALNSKYFDPALLFASVDKMISLLSLTVFYKVSALFFSSIFGWLYLLIILWSIALYFKVAVQVMLLYLTAKLFINFTFLLAPILFLLLLFEQTKDTFEKWLNQIASFSLQQIIILFTFSLFNAILYYLIKSVLAYKVCWGTVWQISLVTKISLFKWWTIAGDMSNPSSDFAPTLISILAIYFMVMIMQEFINSASGFAERLVDGITADSTAKAIQGKVSESIKAMNVSYNHLRSNNETLKKYTPKYGLRDKAMGVVFNAGKGVEDQRLSKLQAEKESNHQRGQMKKAANKAVNEYKAKAIAGKHENDKDNKLFQSNKKEDGKDNAMDRIAKIQDVRDNAMRNYLKEYYESRGKTIGPKEVQEKMQQLKDSRSDNASFSHDSLTSLAFAKMSNKVNMISKNKYDNSDAIKESTIKAKDVKNAYKLLQKDSKKPLSETGKLTPDEIGRKLGEAKKEAYKSISDKKDNPRLSDRRFIDGLDIIIEDRQKKYKEEHGLIKATSKNIGQYSSDTRKGMGETKSYIRKEVPETLSDTKKKTVKTASYISTESKSIISSSPYYAKEVGKFAGRAIDAGTGDRISAGYSMIKSSSTKTRKMDELTSDRKKRKAQNVADRKKIKAQNIDNREEQKAKNTLSRESEKWEKLDSTDAMSKTYNMSLNITKPILKKYHKLDNAFRIAANNAENAYRIVANNLDRFKDARKSDARILAEESLQRKGKIILERNHKKVDPDSGVKKGAVLSDPILQASSAYKSALSGSQNVVITALTALGLRQEWTEEEKNKVDAKESDIEERGGVKYLEERVDEVVERYNKDGGKQDIEDKLGLDIAKIDKDNIRQKVREFLLDAEEGKKGYHRDWRNEIFDNDKKIIGLSDGSKTNEGLEKGDGGGGKAKA
ncbi:type IV secretion system protein [Rickettsiales bacterium]|nr:type IV secretion system protein [Rickettsiales bacterium]